MFSEIVGVGEVVGVVEAAGHQHLVVQCDTGVTCPGLELKVGAPDPEAGLLLQVDPPAVPQDGPVVVQASIDEEAALLLPRLYRGHGGPGSANWAVLKYQTFPPTVKYRIYRMIILYCFKFQTLRC